MQSPVKVWRQQKKDRNYLSKMGTIVTWTKISVAPPAFHEFTPYPVVLVELENGEKVYGQLVDYEEGDLQIGTKVVSILRRSRTVEKEDIVEYGVKFTPFKK